MQKKSREQSIREKRRFWKAHIEAWQKSGYSQAEYCRHSDLVYHRLIYWKAKFNKERSRSVSFVPIPVPVENQPEMQDNALILNLQNDRFRIEISQEFCSKTLSRLVAVLEST